MQLTSRQMLTAMDQALAEVARRLASGELDQSGRYYSDAELKTQLHSRPQRRSVSRSKNAPRRTPKSS